METQLPLPKRSTARHFQQMSAVWIKMPLVAKVNLGPGDIVLDGDSAPPRSRKKEGHSIPHFGPCIVAKRLHGSRSHLVRVYSSAQATMCYMRTQPPLEGAQQAPNFQPMSVVAKQWMDQDGTWYRGKPRPLPHCVRWGRAPKWAQPRPNFRPMSVVAKRLDGSRCHLVRR